MTFLLTVSGQLQGRVPWASPVRGRVFMVLLLFSLQFGKDGGDLAVPEVQSRFRSD